MELTLDFYHTAILIILCYIVFTLNNNKNSEVSSNNVPLKVDIDKHSLKEKIEKDIENELKDKIIIKESQKTCCSKNQLVDVMKINIPTRGCPEETKQIGVLTSSNLDTTIPLYGRRLWNGSSKWNYFTRNDKFVSVVLPVMNCGRDCSEEYGCNEIYDGDAVSVPQVSNEPLKVTLYHMNCPRYIPCV